MLAARIDAILSDFVRRRIPFSHHDVAACIPDLSPIQLEDLRQYVLEKMTCVPAYRLSVVRFVGEGLTVICVPRPTPASVSPQMETPAVDRGRPVA